MRRLVGLALGAALASPVAAGAQSAQYRAGESGYAENCAACHGPAGRGGSGYANPIWGQGAQLGKFRTAAGLFEYHQIMMPFDDPNRVTDELKWAITLYMLANHGVVPRDGQLDPAIAAGIALR